MSEPDSTHPAASGAWFDAKTPLAAAIRAHVPQRRRYPRFADWVLESPRILGRLERTPRECTGL